MMAGRWIGIAAALVLAVVGLAGCGGSATPQSVPYSAKAQHAYWVNTDTMWHHDLVAGVTVTSRAEGDVAASDFESAHDDFATANADFTRGLGDLSKIKPTTRQLAVDRELRASLDSLARGTAKARDGAGSQSMKTIRQGLSVVAIGMGQIHRANRIISAAQHS